MAYENLFQNRGFFRDYEPVVLNTHLPKIAETLRGRYDEGVAAKSLLDRAMGSVRTIGLDDAAINNARMKMDQTINGRVDFENMGKVITDATTGFLTDHNVLNAIDSYASRTKEIQENEALRAKGVQILDFNTDLQRDQNGKPMIGSDGKALFQHRSDAHDSSVSGVYQRASETKLNWEERALQLLQGIAVDSGAIQNAAFAAGVDPAQFGKWLSTGEGVSKDKLARVAGALLDPFMKSQEGVQMFRSLTQLDLNPATGELHTPQEASDRMLKYLNEVGLKQVGYTVRPFGAHEASGTSGGESDSPSITELNLNQSIVSAPLGEEFENMQKSIEALKKTGVTASDNLRNNIKSDKLPIGAMPAASKKGKLHGILKDNDFDFGKRKVIEAINSNMDEFVELVNSEPEILKRIPLIAGEDKFAHATRVTQIIGSPTVQRGAQIPGLENKKAVANHLNSELSNMPVHIPGMEDPVNFSDIADIFETGFDSTFYENFNKAMYAYGEGTIPDNNYRITKVEYMVEGPYAGLTHIKGNAGKTLWVGNVLGKGSGRNPIDMYVDTNISEADRQGALMRKMGTVGMSKNFTKDFPADMSITYPPPPAAGGKVYDIYIRNIASPANPNITRTVILHKNPTTGKYLEEELGLHQSAWTDTNILREQYIKDLQGRAASKTKIDPYIRHYNLTAGVREIRPK